LTVVFQSNRFDTCFELAANHPLLLDLEESCGATLLAFTEELTLLRSNASKSEGRKNHRLPSWHPGIWPLRAMRLTVFGCSRRNLAASVQSQTGSGVEVAAIFIDHPISLKLLSYSY